MRLVEVGGEGCWEGVSEGDVGWMSQCLCRWRRLGMEAEGSIGRAS
jgi:hypothetical protein